MSTLQQCDPDLTVIVPVYNLEHFIGPLLESLIRQDLGSYKVEYIFVLNNCTDNSERVIRDSGLDCTIINCTEQGCGPARNAGMEIAHGQYIWFMDGDDWLLSERAIKTALTAAIVNDLNILRIPFASSSYTYNYFSMVWQYLLRRDFIEEFRFPAIQPAEDDAYMTQVLAKAGYDRVSYLMLPRTDRALYYYNYGREGSNMYRFARGQL